MTDLRVPLDDETSARVADEAARRGITLEQLASLAIGLFVAPGSRTSVRGHRSQRHTDTSENADEILQDQLGA